VQEGIIATNKDGVIIYATDIIEQLFGFSEAELKGENISKLVTGNPLSNDSEIESLVYQYSTENSVNSVKMIGAGQVIMPIQTKGKKINISFLKEPARISNALRMIYDVILQYQALELANYFRWSCAEC
jgi:hypothetical protein